MTVRFPLIRSLLVGLVAVYAGAAASGCADNSSQTDLLNRPEILQVMVFVDPSEQDYLTEPLSGYAITYETVLPLGGNIIATSDYAACFLFNTDGEGQPTTLCQRADQVAMCVCPDGVDGPLSCSQSGDLIGRCVDPDTGKIPIVRHAVTVGASLRIVVGQLLDGATLEHFACACQGSELTSLDPTACGSETAWSDDPSDCGACGGTGDDVGRCVDTDSNGLPDFSSLKLGVATLTCTGLGNCPSGLGGIPGWTGSADSCVYTTLEGDGFFYPSGNQFQSSVTGLGGVGPAIGINPSSALPTDADCSLAIAEFVKFKNGDSLAPPSSTPTFHTEPLALSITAPEDTIDITNSTTLVMVISGTAPLSTADASISVDVTDNNTTTTLNAVNATPDVSGTDITVTFPTIHLVDGHFYTLDVTASAKDAFGQTISDAEISVNTTAAIAQTSKK